MYNEELGINKQPKTQIVFPERNDQNDLCVRQVNCNGAACFNKIGLTRKESFKPKLNEKGTLLSEIVVIGGPSNLTLLKPVVVSMEHNARNINADWNVSLYSAFNSYNSSPDWNVIIFFF